MKKTISVCLVVLLVCSLSVLAFANSRAYIYSEENTNQSFYNDAGNFLGSVSVNFKWKHSSSGGFSYAEICDCGYTHNLKDSNYSMTTVITEIGSNKILVNTSCEPLSEESIPNETSEYQFYIEVFPDGSWSRINK